MERGVCSRQPFHGEKMVVLTSPQLSGLPGACKWRETRLPLCGVASSLSSAQTLVVGWSPVRMAISFEYLYMAGRRDVRHGHAFQMRTTVSSESPAASATMQQPDT